MAADFKVFGTRSIYFFSFLLLLSLFTANPSETFCAFLFIPIAAKFLYRENEPPFLFLAIMLQWLQVTVKIFYADFYDLKITDIFEFPDHIYDAYYLSLLGLLAISIGIWVILRNVPASQRASYEHEVANYSPRKITTLYIISSLLTPVLVVVGNYSGGFRQFFEKFVTLNWTIFFIFYLIAFIRNEGKREFSILIFIQVLLSFTGFYSSFKEYFMFLMLGYLVIHQTLKLRQLIVIGIIGVIGFNIFVVWQQIKPEYRSFLIENAREGSKGTKQDQFKKLTQLAGEMDSAAYNNGLIKLIERTSYIDYFSAAISHVPNNIPHEDGAMWGGAVAHVFTPRIFFPNKPIIDDSELASKYTGVEMYGLEQGTSISLGYMAESYVDYGMKMMLVPLFLFGLVIGAIYRYILTNSINQIWGVALLLPLFFQLNVFEQALTKMVGGTIAYFLVIVIIMKLGLIRYLDRFISYPYTYSHNHEKSPNTLSGEIA